MALIEVNNVTKTFKGKKVLDNLSLNIEKGEIYGLIGPSGSGKSVLLRIIMRFFKPDSGEVYVHTQSKDSIGFSLQENSLYDNLTVRQNLQYFAKLYNIEGKIAKDLISRLIILFDLEGYERVLIRKLSGGTKKRVDIACAILKDPEIVILDEPLLGLDPRLVSNILKLIDYLHNKGKTVIITSHMIPEISAIATRFGMMKNGKVCPIEKSRLMEAYQ